ARCVRADSSPKDVDMKGKLITAVLAAALMAGAAACTNDAASASPGKHAKTHKATTSRVITAKAHIDGTSRYFLTLKGKRQPASVTKQAFRRCAIDDRYPTCANK
ncbi:hypothetical protein NE236_41695, partial [Actinoallomurus purpureus]|uniref:hypothetical protein n=1 Tax=Actinoallomurus purpureus TaxID=478114 RepID=UPI0020927553